MSNKETVVQELNEEQIEQVSGGDGEIISRYLSIQPEDTKGGELR